MRAIGGTGTARRRVGTPHRGWGRVLAVMGAVVLGGTAPAGVAVAQPAPDESAILCDGRIDGAGLIPGDLHVAAGDDCVVVGSVVAGDAVVEAGATLRLERAAVRGDLTADGRATMTSSAVKGDVEIRRHGDLRRSTVHGGIHLTGQAASLSLDDVTVRRSIRGAVTGLRVRDSRVEGAVNVTGISEGPFSTTRVVVVRSEVGGWVNLVRTHTRVEYSDLGRGLTATRPEDLRMCATTIADDLTVQDTPLEVDHRGVPDNTVAIGVAVVCEAPSPHHPAEPPNVVIGGTVRLLRNTPVGVTIANTAVDGDLVCRGNAGERGPGVTTYHLVVGGQRLGQCA